jgi:hypothetical protein
VTLQFINSAAFSQRRYEQKRTKQMGIWFPEFVRKLSRISRFVARFSRPISLR